jgi:hypothetical protein
MNRLCERTSMRRNRRFVRTGMSAAQIRECPEAGECDERDEATNATSSADGPQACLRLSFERRDRAVAIDERAMRLFIHAGRMHVG